MNDAVWRGRQELVRKLLVLLLCALAGYIAYPWFRPAVPQLAEQDQPSLYTAYAYEEERKELEESSVTEVMLKLPSAVMRNEEVITVPEETVIEQNHSPFEGPLLVLVGTQSSSTKELAKDTEMLAYSLESGEWPEYRQYLQRSLEQEYGKIRLIRSGAERYRAVWSEARYYQCLLRWNLLGALEGANLELSVSDDSASSLMQWLMGDDRAMEEMLITLDQADDREAVFQFLVKVWNHELDDQALAKKYFNLALACSVVFDQKVAYKNETSYGKYVDGLDRYLWYKKMNEGGLTEVSIDRSSARDLVFVVCSPVSEQELEWALRKYRSLRRKSWGDTFSEVEYLMERAVEGLNPYAEYTLPEILKEGGICGDQSYFCVNTARAAGIPAFTLTGITNSGGHAWVAAKIETDEWSTKIGRIGGVSKGMGGDPQRGTRVSEQDVWLWSDRDHQQRDKRVEVERHLWLSDYLSGTGYREQRAEVIYTGLQIGQRFPHMWQHAYQIMLLDEAFTANPKERETLDKWTEFSKAMRREFKQNPRMAELAEEVENKHIYPYEEMAEVRRQLARSRRRNERDASEQADIVTMSLKREASLLVARDEENALREIGQLYDRSLRDYGGSLTGFRSMAEDYFAFVENDEVMAKKAVQDIDLAFKRVVETGSKDWFRTKAEVSLHKMICQFYRKVGEVKRAENRERRLERLMERAKRGAL